MILLLIARTWSATWRRSSRSPRRCRSSPPRRAGSPGSEAQPGHIGDPRRATAEKGETLFRVFSEDVVTFLERVIAWDGRSGMADMDSSASADGDSTSGPRSGPGAVCGLLLLATMLNVHGPPDARAAEDRDPRRAAPDQRGVRPARAGFRPGVRGRGDRHGVHRRPDQRALALPRSVLLGWSAVGFATGWVTDFRSCSSAGCCSGSSRRGSGRALVTTQRLLLATRSDAGQQHPPERRIARGDRHADRRAAARDQRRAGSWRLPFRVIGALGVFWVVALAGRDPVARPGGRADRGRSRAPEDETGRGH